MIYLSMENVNILPIPICNTSCRLLLFGLLPASILVKSDEI